MGEATEVGLQRRGSGSPGEGGWYSNTGQFLQKRCRRYRLDDKEVACCQGGNGRELSGSSLSSFTLN